MPTIAKTLEESARARSWLRQFETIDREVARQFLRSLRLVSESEFEREVLAQIAFAVESKPAETFALLSVTEKPSPFAAREVRRTPGSSADRVKHLIENAARVFGPRVCANPTVESMRAQRVRNIVLVDDFVGSGRRVKTFWKELVSPSVKSWVSRHWAVVWVVSYGALQEGLRASVGAIHGLDRSRFRTALDPDSTRLGLTEPMRSVFSRIGAAAGSCSHGLGFGKGGCMVVFQHGCPNNSPLVLWKQVGELKPLFPDRGVPEDLQGFFGNAQPLERAELLWNSQQYKLALKLLEGMEQGSPPLAHWELVIALGLSARHQRWDDDWLAQKMRLPTVRVAQIRSVAYSLSLIDSSSHLLTGLGRELLNRVRTSGAEAARSSSSFTKAALNDVYYPESCGGRPKQLAKRGV